MSKILLVEDDTSIAKLYKTELSLRGHEVSHVTDGKDLVDVVVKTNPDIILLDIQLPTIDGLSVLADLKKNEKTKNIKVLMLSNYANEENIEKALSMGAVDFIPKHRIVPEELGVKVESILAQ
ncbi:response regulator [Patescibacteria group bacterium]|nr:response regulator [Patescibacteria group bacterium]